MLHWCCKVPNVFFCDFLAFVYCLALVKFFFCGGEVVEQILVMKARLFGPWTRLLRARVEMCHWKGAKTAMGQNLRYLLWMVTHTTGVLFWRFFASYIGVFTHKDVEKVWVQLLVVINVYSGLVRKKGREIEALISPTSTGIILSALQLYRPWFV